MRPALCSLLTACLLLISPACRAPQPAAPAPDPQLAVNTLLPAPPGFLDQRLASGAYPQPPYAKFLAGAKICLDPGHGGDAHQRGFKRGPSGVREAEVNLRVADYLQALLQRAGAEVLLTRTADTYMENPDRARLANEWGADLFISLHHNAISNKPAANHTTVWYHADVDYHPASLDLARYLCQGLYDTLALPQISDVPLKSDQLMYKEGFAVLRHAQVTAALTETSFFTNPEEEQRLRDPEYNLREAYGLFLGLARYAAAGLPRVSLAEPQDGILTRPAGPASNSAPSDTSDAETGGDDGAALLDDAPQAQAGAEPNSDDFESAGLRLVLQLDDGLRARKSWGAERSMILSDTVAIRLGPTPSDAAAGALAPAAYHLDPATYRLTVHLPADLAPGEYALEVHFANMNKNSVLNPRVPFRVE